MHILEFIAIDGAIEGEPGMEHPVSNWTALIENKFAFNTAWPNEFYIFNSFRTIRK